jgi:hypothetical protein
MGSLTSSPEPALEKSLKNADGDAKAGMKTVVHVIAAIDVVDVHIIRVVPTYRPRVNEPERIAAVLEAPIIVVASVDMEAVAAAKTGAVMVVRNAAMIVTTAVSSVTLWLLGALLVLSGVTLLYAIALL